MSFLSNIGWAERLLLLPISYHVVLFVAAVLEDKPGKALYWVGATILTIGLFLQRG